jgi:hyperosmotically inducible protein
MERHKITNKMELIFVIPTTVSSISVQTFEGNVTLTGAVENETQRERATAIVEGVYGVRKVNNLLMIKKIIRSRPEK